MSSLSGLTYTDLAARYEVELCDDACAMTTRDHLNGWFIIRIVHWKERRVQRRSLYRFLKLVGAARGVTNGSYSVARNLYLLNLFAYNTALHDLGIRFPARFSSEDRARARALLARAPYTANRRMHDWAARG